METSPLGYRALNTKGYPSRATAFTFWYSRSEKETIAINLKKN
jgi:hypothetical protein